jgi:hypothetical protein
MAKRRVRKFGGGRTNLLEELGRVEGERSNKNRRAEVSRIHGELNRGYKAGGPARTIGKSKDTLRDKLKKLRPRHAGKRKNPFEALGGGEKGKPHSTEKGRIAAGARKVLRTLKARPQLERQRSMDRKPSPKVKPEWPKKENIMTPLRAKKAGGGRISRGHGGSAAQQHYLQHGYGPTKAKLRTGKPKIAKKGWA